MEPHMFEYNKKPICYILWSIFQFVLWLRESICCFKSLWSLKLLKILPLWTRNKDFSKIEGFVKRDNYSKWNGAALIGIHRLFIFITKSVLCRRKEEKTLQFIINQMIISKNPQFTGISARQQLEFTTHLLLTDWALICFEALADRPNRQRTPVLTYHRLKNFIQHRTSGVSHSLHRENRNAAFFMPFVTQ